MKRITPLNGIDSESLASILEFLRKDFTLEEIENIIDSQNPSKHFPFFRGIFDFVWSYFIFKNGDFFIRDFGITCAASWLKNGLFYKFPLDSAFVYEDCIRCDSIFPKYYIFRIFYANKKEKENSDFFSCIIDFRKGNNDIYNGNVFLNFGYDVSNLPFNVFNNNLGSDIEKKILQVISERESVG